eukprot:TRINITY_DN20261_c0_g1_i4.p1 TRINITY_DN20261_c0_g1~~TRINITY_DN20261_c0_g1_i4.p1  ORF type:complete len:219 (+),score=23.21 TRINITY_DN20261_c0_g1_i4:143-799(+)
MIRRPPRSTLSSSSAASDVYKRQSLYSARSHSIMRNSIIGREGSTSQHPDMTGLAIGANSMSASTGEMMGAIAEGSFPSSRRHTGGSPQFLQRHSSLAGRGNQSGVTTPHLTNPVVTPSPRDHGVALMSNSLSSSSSPKPAPQLSTTFVYPDETLTSQPRRTREGSEVFLSLIHISEPTRLLSISYAVFCLKKKKKKPQIKEHIICPKIQIIMIDLTY